MRKFDCLDELIFYVLYLHLVPSQSLLLLFAISCLLTLELR